MALRRDIIFLQGWIRRAGVTVHASAGARAVKLGPVFRDASGEFPVRRSAGFA